MMAKSMTTTTTLIMKDAPKERQDSQLAPLPAHSARAARGPIALWGGLLLAILLPTFGSLGMWQWNKWEARLARQAILDARSRGPLLTMPGTLSSLAELRDHHFTLRGEYDAGLQILIDNRIQHEQAGYEVITPLHLAGSPLHVLVNRGWVPAPADHRQLPDVPVPGGTVSIRGVALKPGEHFFTLGTAPSGDWQSVWQDLDWGRFQRSVAYPLQPVVIQLDADVAGGYGRDWPRPDEHAERNLSYALQWFGFAVASLGIWLYFLLRRP